MGKQLLSNKFSQPGGRWVPYVFALIVSVTGVFMILTSSAATNNTPVAPLAAQSTLGSTTVSVSTAAQLVSALKDPANSGGTILMTANLGTFTIDGARPAELITVKPGTGGGTLGTIRFSNDNSNIRIEGFRMTTVQVNYGNSLNTTNQNLQFANCTAGGTSTARISPLAIFEIYGNADNILIDNCDIGWTDTSASQDQGYGVRAINGSGVITNLKITRSKIHHVGCDGVQLGLGANSNFTLDRTEIAYAASGPGTDCHSDSMQIMGSGGTNYITNNWIHHTGYYDDNYIPSSSGQMILHGWNGSTPWIVQNNLFTNNRNFTPEYKQENDGSFARNWTWDHNTILSSFNTEGSGCSGNWNGAQAALTNNIIRQYCEEFGATYDTVSGNIGIDSSPEGGIRLAVTFDSTYEPTNLPAGYTGAGYRVPTDVHWAPGATRVPGVSTESTPTDTTNPTVSITAPAANATVSGTVAATASANDDVGVSKVEFFVDGSSTPAATDMNAPYSFSWDTTGLANGSHSVSAKATDTSNNVSVLASAQVTVQNGDVTAPTAPTTLTATAISATQVNLSWSGATDNVGVTGYLVYRYKTSSGASSAAVIATLGNVASYSDTTVTGNTGYSYYIVAKDAAGNISANSVTKTVTTPTPPDVTAPTSPTNASAAVASATQVNLSWTASTDSGSSGLAGYNIYRNGTKINASLVTGTSYGDSTVSVNTTYTYTIEAMDGAGNTSSKASTTPVSVTTPSGTVTDTTPPSVPTSVSASTSPATITTGTSITVTWTASTDSGGSGLAGYKLYRNGALVATTTSTSYTDYYLLPGTTYDYTVKAYDNNNNHSAASSAVHLATSSRVGDLDGDSKVTGHDLSLFLARFGTNDARVDFDGSPPVTAHDLSMLLTNYGK